MHKSKLFVQYFTLFGVSTEKMTTFVVYYEDKCCVYSYLIERAGWICDTR